MSHDPEELKLEIVELVAPEEGQPGSLALALGSAPFFSEELDALKAKIERGEKLTNDERARRQGIIFNHSGKASGFCVI